MKAGWEVRKLGEVCTFLGGGTPSKERADFWDGDIPWVSPKDMKSDIISTSIDKITAAAIAGSATKLIPIGSILIVVRSGILARTIPTGITACELTVNQDIKALAPKKSVTSHFLAYYMQSMEAEILDLVTRGATVHRLDTGAIKSLPIPLPPLDEQKRIVEVLDAAFDGLARARAHSEANLQNARELFEGFVRAIMLDCENNYEAKSLATIAENLDRRRVPITKSDRIAGDVPYYGASGVVDHVEGYLFDEELLLISEDGANLLARTYPIAFSISGKTWVNNHAHILRFADRNEQEFVSLYLNSISLVPFVSGMAQPKLNQQEMNKIPVPLPDPATCEQIVAKAGAIGAESVQLQTHYRAKLADLDDLRQALLQKAFAGQLC